ncbi:MAG: gluconate 2-dehydrogenase subunit 3 family protein [Phenylobacterium sp.]|uniref:gluconate 2-dehydrogenase subunit 3 family protein n=1 Tax=Phenylobacterium sp. TaxID=1871053 RepID=UPI001A43425D|nr:gluconate 2-dehydrogenase subunit 3 family protein [Phenylobacterium sp.]MBL8772057.1 gluconate 2-dehydrogenase subunit 3 family protein [Phenylobacterium sp.]
MLRLTRRDAFLGLAAASGWSALAVAQTPASAPPAWTPRALTAAQARALTAAAERIIPATDTPGAVEAGVPQYVDRAIATWCAPDQAQRLKAGLDQLDADARSAHGAPFAALAAPLQTGMLSTLDAESRTRRPHFFAELKELVTAGYFTSEPGATRALRYDPVPGDYRGCVPLSEIGRAWAT